MLVTILGEPGMGKSRLADELVAGLGDEVIVLAARTRSYADTATFAPAAAIVAELAGLEDGDAPDTATAPTARAGGSATRRRRTRSGSWSGCPCCSG